MFQTSTTGAAVRDRAAAPRASGSSSDHVRDVSRSPDMLQVCRCGHVTRTIAEMREHVAMERARERTGLRSSRSQASPKPLQPLG